MAKNSTAEDVSNKPYVKNAGVKALSDHYSRIGVKAKVTAKPDKPGYYEVIHDYGDKPTMIVPLFSNETLVAKYLEIMDKGGLS